LSDGYLELKGKAEAGKEREARRFFKIAQDLPLELKMLVTQKVYLSDRIFFLSNQTEESLKRVLSHPF